jgi:Flp pilus assembly pilin Flp
MLAMWSRLLVALHRDPRGQGTVEYVLVILAVTAVAIALISWVRGSGTGLLGSLFSKIIGFVTGKAQF